MELHPSLADLPARYAELLSRAQEVLGSDERVRAVWVSGSWARGDADPGSDLDLVVATADEGHASFVGSARQWWTEITPTVLLETVLHAPNVWYSMTPDGRRLDIVIERESDVVRSPHRNRVALIDPHGLSALVPPAPVNAGPDANGVEWRLKELFRALCLIEVLIVREDWLLGVQGCALMQRTLADLYAAANGASSPNGVKHYSSRLTSEQKATLEALPPIAATRDAVMAGHHAILDAVTSTVPALADQLGITWPSSLEQTARTQLGESRT